MMTTQSTTAANYPPVDTLRNNILWALHEWILQRPGLDLHTLPTHLRAHLSAGRSRGRAGQQQRGARNHRRPCSFANAAAIAPWAWGCCAGEPRRCSWRPAGR